jgi:hypothetical protein
MLVFAVAIILVLIINLQHQYREIFADLYKSRHDLRFFPKYTQGFAVVFLSVFFLFKLWTLASVGSLHTTYLNIYGFLCIALLITGLVYLIWEEEQVV